MGKTTWDYATRSKIIQKSKTCPYTSARMSEAMASPATPLRKSTWTLYLICSHKNELHPTNYFPPNDKSISPKENFAVKKTQTKQQKYTKQKSLIVTALTPSHIHLIPSFPHPLLDKILQMKAEILLFS